MADENVKPEEGHGELPPMSHPETEAATQVADPQDDYAFLEDELYNETPAAETASEPAPEPEPEKAKPSTPSYTAQRALGYGYTQEQIDQMPPGVLDVVVQQMDALALKAYRASQTQAQGQQQPAPEPEIDELEGTFDPVLVKHIKGLQAKAAALEQEILRTKAEQQQAKATEFRTRFDQMAGDYGVQDHGTKVEIATVMSGLDLANKNIGKTLTEAELFERAARSMGLEKVRTAKAKDQWKNGGAARPTNRSSDEPPSEDKARKNLRERLRALGLADGGEDEEDFFG